MEEKETLRINRRTASKKTTAPRRATAPAQHGPSHDEIARRAYELFEARGRLDGFHLEDWLRAEAELRPS